MSNYKYLLRDLVFVSALVGYMINELVRAI